MFKRHSTGLPAVLRFARFRVIGIPLVLVGLEVKRETAQTAKAWPSFRSSLSRARSCKTCNRQHKALVPLTTRQKRNTETRARVCLVLVGDRVNAATQMASKRVPV